MALEEVAPGRPVTVELGRHHHRGASRPHGGQQVHHRRIEGEAGLNADTVTGSEAEIREMAPHRIVEAPV